MLTRRNFIALTALSLCACHAAGPADPVWGKQACAHCRMLVSDPRYAAQALGVDGQFLHFDDVGCMVSYLTEHAAVSQRWVRDESGQWRKPESVRFQGGAATPMDYGFAVSASGEFDFAAVTAKVSRPRHGGS